MKKINLFLYLFIAVLAVSFASCGSDDDEEETFVSAVGDYYYSDGSQSATLDASKTCIGIVFKAKTKTEKGLVVSLKETEISWSTEKVITNVTNHSSGAINMATIKKIEGWREKYPAFAWCADLGEGWYLPSKDEIQLLYCVYYRIPIQTWDWFIDPEKTVEDVNAPDIVSKFGTATMSEAAYWCSVQGYSDEATEDFQTLLATECACALDFGEIVLLENNVHFGGCGFGVGWGKQSLLKTRAILAF